MLDLKDTLILFACLRELENKTMPAYYREITLHMISVSNELQTLGVLNTKEQG